MYKTETCVIHVKHCIIAFRDLHVGHVPNEVKQ